jgi:hypothetical protein
MCGTRRQQVDSSRTQVMYTTCRLIPSLWKGRERMIFPNVNPAKETDASFEVFDVDSPRQISN